MHRLTVVLILTRIGSGCCSVLQDSNAGIGHRLRAGRRAEAGDLRSDDRLLQEARCGERSDDADGSRHIDAGPDLLLRAHLVEREPEEDRSLSRDRAAAGEAGRIERGAGARAGARREAARAHRRRAALDRSRRPAAHAAARARSAVEAIRSADRADSRQRHPDAVADDQSRRPPDGRRLVHEEHRHAATNRCRASTRNTSATTTTATPTCST